MTVAVKDRKGLWKKHPVLTGLQVRCAPQAAHGAQIVLAGTALHPGVLVLRIIHNLGRARLGGPLHTTPTTVSIFSNQCDLVTGIRWGQKYEAPIADSANQPMTL